MRSPTFLLAILLLIFTQIAIAQSSCDCYLTNGSTSYFTSYSFFDFRDIPDTSPRIPQLLANTMNTTNAVATSSYLKSANFTTFWTAQTWNNTSSRGRADEMELMVNSQNNVYIESSTDHSADYNTYLTLRTARLPTFQSAAELDSVAQNYHYLSLRLVARVVGSPGACAGIFTYRPPPPSSPQSEQEADLEILTTGPRNAIQYTNQPSTNPAGDVIPQATDNATLGDGVWTDWHTYRVDWTPGMMNWYVDGDLVTRNGFNAPRDPAGVILNMWSNGGSWTGNMTLYDEAFLKIQWIEMVFNTSGSIDGKAIDEGLEKRNESRGCKVVCSVDENVTVIGSPVVLWGTTGKAGKMEIAELAWLYVILVGFVVFGCL